MPFIALPADSGKTGLVRLLVRLLAFYLVLLSGLHTAKAQDTEITPIIDLASLKALLEKHDPNVLLVDVRDSDKFQIDHLPGAINLPVELTFNNEGDPTRIASLQQIRELLSDAGINNTDYLILYDDGLLKNAAHVFWVLETYGQKKLSVLDGGIAGWVAQHGELSQVVKPRPPSQYIPNIATHRLTTELATLLAIQNPNVSIIDARDQQEYLGIVSKARRKGHIAGAISIPWTNNLQENAQVHNVKPKATLQSLYNNIDKHNQVITYCNRGKESAVTYLVLRNLGYNVSVYDGAWLEWGNDDHLPIETGEKTKHGAASHD